MVYCFLRLMGSFIFNFLYSVKVKGRENVPLKGRVILAASHASFLDPMVIFHTSPRRSRPVAAKWLTHIWWLGWVFRAAGCVPTNGSSKGALAALNNEEAILIFPEGRCQPDGNMLPARKGVAVFALKTGSPVVPICVLGTFASWPVGNFCPKFFKRIVVCFGSPLFFDKVNSEIVPEDMLMQVTNKIMEEIKKLNA